MLTVWAEKKRLMRIDEIREQSADEEHASLI